MQDLTTGPITRHLLKTTSFMLVTMVFQTLYFLVDLYWVGRIGTQAVAAVGIAGNLSFLVLALTQMLGVGTTTVVSHAVGRRDVDGARMLFNQCQVLALVVGALFLAAALATMRGYAVAQSADAATARLAIDYLAWFIPSLALQFAMVAMGSALRAVGNFKTGMVISTATIVMNIVLAPFLIFGWGTGRAFGVAGAAISTLASIAFGCVWLVLYFLRSSTYLRFDVAEWRPRLDVWRRVLAVGMPAGVEFALMAAYMAIVYAVARPFGASAQAGFGIGQRVTQALYMPIVALGFSVAPVAGQNFGARLADRVVRTFRDGAAMAVGFMLLIAVVCHAAPEPLIRAFSKDPAVLAVGAEYVRVIAFGFVASGLVFVCASMFQAMGNTVPSLVASVTRIVVVATPVVLLSRRADFRLDWIWDLSLAGSYLQVVLVLLLLRREFARRLDFPAREPMPVAVLAVGD